MVFLSIIRSSRLHTQHQVYVIQVSWLLASRYVKELVPSCSLASSQLTVWHIPDAVCAVLNSWWWMERPSETCRAMFNKLENCASSWFHYINYGTSYNLSVQMTVFQDCHSHSLLLCFPPIPSTLHYTDPGTYSYHSKYFNKHNYQTTGVTLLCKLYDQSIITFLISKTWQKKVTYMNHKIPHYVYNLNFPLCHPSMFQPHS